jgi:outer membrane protein TolC
VKKYRIILVLVVTVFYTKPCLSQATKKFDVLNDNIETMLPPLETIIDSAIFNNPYVKFRDLQIGVNQNKLEANQLQWSRNLGIQADGRYGTFNNFSTNTSEGQTPSTVSTLTSQFNWGFGAYIKFPLFDVIGRKTQVGLSELEVVQAEEMAQMQRNEVRQAVIKQYNELILSQRLLRNKSKYVETANISMNMAETEFKNGVIPLAEFARISEIESKAELDFETAKMSFTNAYMILEELAGIKFNLNISAK